MSTQQQPFPDWERPHFTQAAGQNLLYFIVYGKALSEMNISGDKYRAWHMPKELNLSSHHQNANPEQLKLFREGIFESMLQEQLPELVADIQAAEHCYIIQAILPDKPNLNDFRVGVGIVTYLLDCGGIAVFDPLAYQWWSPEEWHKKAFEPEQFDPFAHVKILVSPEHNESSWVYTHGLRKFGRPDLGIHYVNEEEMDAVLEMIDRFIAFMAGGGLINEGQEIRMHDLPEGMVCHYKDTMSDPRFNNIHVEISWPDPDTN